MYMIPRSICDNVAFANMLDQKRRNALANVPPTRYDNLASNPYLQINPNTQMYFTKFDLDMRRKAEVLEYNANKTSRMTNNLTKRERWAAVVNGAYQQRTYSQAFIKENTLPNGYVQVCPSGNLILKPTSASDVPGPPMMLYMDPTIPLYNYASDSETRTYAVINDMYSPTLPFGYTKDTNISIPRTISVSNGIQFTTFTSIYLMNPPEQSTMTFSIQTPVSLNISNTMITQPTTLYSETAAFTIYATNVFLRPMFSTSQVILSRAPTITTSFQYSSSNPLSMDLSMNTVNRYSYSANVYFGTVSINNLTLRSIKGYIYDIQLGVEYTLIPNTGETSKYLQYFGANNEDISSYANVTRDAVLSNNWVNCSCTNNVPQTFPQLSIATV